jgi:hypothetical protein
MKTRLIWLGLGAAALTTTIPNPHTQASPTALDAATARTRPTPAQGVLRIAQTHQHGAPAKAGAGEAGEGGEGNAAKADADSRLDPAVRSYRDIQLVRGHLLVGDELVSDGRWADALPHFLHPVEELYEKLGPDLKARKLKAFLQPLKALAQTVKAKNKGAYTAAFAQLVERLDAVDAGMKSAQKDWLPFVVETALETLRSAAGEYGESIEDGKFTKAVEYQDSRGFVWQVERLLTSVDAALAAKDPGAATKSRTELAALKAAWPAVLPPAKPVLDTSQVAAAISKIELALGSIK